MERFPAQSSHTKSEMARRRQQEIEQAWGGMSLSEAISSSPFKRSIPSNLDPNPQRNRVNRNAEAIEVPTGSHIDNQMDTMNQPVRLAENLYQNYDLIGEHNALEDEYEDYLREMEEAKDVIEEEKDPDLEYWEQMRRGYDMRHTNTNPPFPRSTNNRPIRHSNSVPVSQDHRPLRMNPTGQYNLDFIDWENEWERAYEAMEVSGKLPSPNLIIDPDDDSVIPGMTARQIEELYNALGGNEEEESTGVKEDIMKKFKVQVIKSKKLLDKLDTCSI